MPAHKTIMPCQLDGDTPSSGYGIGVRGLLWYSSSSCQDNLNSSITSCNLDLVVIIVALINVLACDIESYDRLTSGTVVLFMVYRVESGIYRRSNGS